MKGATAAASEAIAGAAVILGQGSIVDVPAAIVGLASVLILCRFKIPDPFGSLLSWPTLIFPGGY